MPVKAIPDGYTSLTPYLIVDGAARAIEVYKQIFGAIERFRIAAPGDRIGHAELQIGNARLMIADEFPEIGARCPGHYGGTPMSLLVYLPDVDAAYARALQAGCKVLKALQNQFYGDRAGTFEDPFGHKWTVATHVEDVSPEEMERRAEAQHEGGTG